jgi:hypothetical protein
MKTRTKNIKKIFSYFKNKLNCDDVVVSLTDDFGKFMISVAVHKSKSFRYDGIVQIKSVQIGDIALDKQIYEVLDQAAEYFKTILVPLNDYEK